MWCFCGSAAELEVASMNVVFVIGMYWTLAGSTLERGGDDDGVFIGSIKRWKSKSMLVLAEVAKKMSSPLCGCFGLLLFGGDRSQRHRRRNRLALAMLLWLGRRVVDVGFAKVFEANHSEISNVRVRDVCVSIC